jgi:hypothetical protein
MIKFKKDYYRKSPFMYSFVSRHLNKLRESNSQYVFKVLLSPEKEDCLILRAITVLNSLLLIYFKQKNRCNLKTFLYKHIKFCHSNMTKFWHLFIQKNLLKKGKYNFLKSMHIDDKLMWSQVHIRTVFLKVQLYQFLYLI